jgi:hypothetical protein
VSERALPGGGLENPPLLIARKLGVRAGDRLALVHPPLDFWIGDLPDDVDVRSFARPPRRRFAMVIAFYERAAALAAEADRLSGAIVADGALWIAWPRRAAGLSSDLSDSLVRTAGLSSGLVDVKVAALGERWSSLRFVVRVEQRGSWPGSPRAREETVDG